MLHIPILRGGNSYTSLEQVELQDHRDGTVLVTVSHANTGLIVKDMADYAKAWEQLQKFSMEEIFAIFKKTAHIFMQGTVDIGGIEQTPGDFVRYQSATTGLPEVMCRQNMEKINFGLSHIKEIISGLTRGIPEEILDKGYGSQNDSMVSFLSKARHFGAVLPNNSPGVHSLWLPALALKTPVVLKPGGQEPWTPLRLCLAFIKAGYPPEAFGFYGAGHEASSTILYHSDRAMVFGDANTVRMWAKYPSVQVHGPGFSKIILADDVVENWQEYLDIMVTSIAANGGRSCINTSVIWTTKYAQEIAEALSKRLAQIEPKELSDANAPLAAFSNPQIARAINNAIENGLCASGAEDITAKYRSSERLVEISGSSFLCPTVVWCKDRSHPLAHKEFLFPYASVVQMSKEQMLSEIEPTLVVTAITKNKDFAHKLYHSRNIDRLNLGAIPTCRVDWKQPHEGNLFELLYERRSFQMQESVLEN